MSDFYYPFRYVFRRILHMGTNFAGMNVWRSANLATFAFCVMGLIFICYTRVIIISLVFFRRKRVLSCRDFAFVQWIASVLLRQWHIGVIFWSLLEMEGDRWALAFFVDRDSWRWQLAFVFISNKIFSFLVRAKLQKLTSWGMNQRDNFHFNFQKFATARVDNSNPHDSQLSLGLGWKWPSYGWKTSPMF